MKQSILGILALCLLTAFLAGCSNPDGPSLSDDELLKRGAAGHNAGQQRPNGNAMPGASAQGTTGH